MELLRGSSNDSNGWIWGCKGRARFGRLWRLHWRLGSGCGWEVDVRITFFLATPRSSYFPAKMGHKLGYVFGQSHVGRCANTEKKNVNVWRVVSFWMILAPKKLVILSLDNSWLGIWQEHLSLFHLVSVFSCLRPAVVPLVLRGMLKQVFAPGWSKKSNRKVTARAQLPRLDAARRRSTPRNPSSKENGSMSIPRFGWFSGWWFQTFFIFPIILGLSSSQLTNIFQRGGSTTEQFLFTMPCVRRGGIHRMWTFGSSNGLICFETQIFFPCFQRGSHSHPIFEKNRRKLTRTSLVYTIYIFPRFRLMVWRGHCTTPPMAWSLKVLVSWSPWPFSVVVAPGQKWRWAFAVSTVEIQPPLRSARRSAWTTWVARPSEFLLHDSQQLSLLWRQRVSKQSRAPQRKPSLGCRILALGELEIAMCRLCRLCRLRRFENCLNSFLINSDQRHAWHTSCSLYQVHAQGR